jgi:hypothetical protein
MDHPDVGRLHWNQEVLELPNGDSQQLLALLPADEATSQAVGRLRRGPGSGLRAV